MTAFIQKNSSQIILVLVSIIVGLLFILFTDIHVAQINRQIQQTIHHSL